jgi:hypothetical protein
MPTLNLLIANPEFINAKPEFINAPALISKWHQWM